ncbi:PTS family membrane transport system protein [Salmonella bongori]|nr:PTS family membrane transport system protein [Salmonella bongori]
MRLIDYFPEASITIKPAAVNWQEAVDFSMASLLANRYINENYIQAIKDSTVSNGPYYILAPGVAIASCASGVWRVENRDVINLTQPGREVLLTRMKV